MCSAPTSLTHSGRRSVLRHGVALILAVPGLLAANCAPGMNAALSRVVRLGWLSFLSRELVTAQNPSGIQAFLQGFSQYGWVEGKNFTIEWRSSNGHDDRLPGLAAELVALPVDVIVVVGTQVAAAAKQATSTIPIVFANTADPVEAGLVQSLARPGGNLTGTAQHTSEVAAKKLSILRELLPGLVRVACLQNPSNSSNQADIRELQGAATRLGLQLQILDVRSEPDIDPAFAAARGARAQALYVESDQATVIASQRIVALAERERLPAIYSVRGGPGNGGLMYYGATGTQTMTRAGYYVDRILRGAQPADLPVEQPNNYEFVVNVKTAQALGITFPPQVAAQVTEWVD
jgi:putative ABC transport system substrate-binding protein